MKRYLNYLSIASIFIAIAMAGTMIVGAEYFRASLLALFVVTQTEVLAIRLHLDRE